MIINKVSFLTFIAKEVDTKPAMKPNLAPKATVVKKDTGTISDKKGKPSIDKARTSARLASSQRVKISKNNTLKDKVTVINEKKSKNSELSTLTFDKPLIRGSKIPEYEPSQARVLR